MNNTDLTLIDKKNNELIYNLAKAGCVSLYSEKDQYSSLHFRTNKIYDAGNLTDKGPKRVSLEDKENFLNTQLGFYKPSSAFIWSQASEEEDVQLTIQKNKFLEDIPFGFRVLDSSLPFATLYKMAEEEDVYLFCNNSLTPQKPEKPNLKTFTKESLKKLRLNGFVVLTIIPQVKLVNGNFQIRSQYRNIKFLSKAYQDHEVLVQYEGQDSFFVPEEDKLEEYINNPECNFYLEK